jgi:hypothetical protein
VISGRFAPRAALAAALAVCSSASGEIYLYEGFGANGVGWAPGSAWRVTSISDPKPSVTVNPAAGVDFSDYDDRFGTSGRLEFRPGFDSVASNRQFAVAPPAGSTFWVSYLAEYVSIDTANFNYFMSETASNAGYSINNPFGPAGTNRLFGAHLDAEATALERAGVNVDLTDERNAALSFTSGTYLVLAKFQSIRADTTNYDFGQTWFLTPAHYDAIMADDVATEDELSANSVGTVIDTDVPTSGQPLYSADDYHIFDTRRVEANVDELKYVSALQDVFTPVPEPAGFALLAAGGLALLARRPR